MWGGWLIYIYVYIYKHMSLLEKKNIEDAVSSQIILSNMWK